MEKKLTDEEVIEVLKNCGAGIHSSNRECRNCVLEHDGRCVNNLRKYSLDLIHRLQDDYSKLKERYIKVLDLNEKVIAEQKAEIERLTEEKWKVQDDLDNYHAMLQESEKKNYELQKQVDELREENTELYKEHTALIAGSILRKKQVQKDTAKEILDELFETKFKIGNDYVIYADNIKVFAERYGVSYEEND